MRSTRSIAFLGIATLFALGWTACGAADAQNHLATDDQTEVRDGASTQERGFIERVLDPRPEPPPPIVVPAGTLLALRLENTLSSHETPVGQTISAMVTQEVSVDGRVAIRAGSVVRGRVLEARPAKKIGGRPILSLTFDELEVRDGEVVAISSHLTEVGKSEVLRDVAIIGGGTIGGAVIGEAIHEGEGGTIGAIVGGIAGTVGALKTKGKPVVLPAGTPLGLTLDSAVTLGGGS